ncbi:phage recombination protein Bet [Streptomyces sp. NPDC058417]|uniref:phage recombination protein Bet n=1 Tax=unclassified Streptomyces TaxID=2593676 RepID=UPI00364CFD32
MSAEITKAGGALAIRPDQTVWTPEQAAVLQQSGIDNEVTGAELSSFLHLCQRTQLDPFSRQIYLIGRYDRRAGRKVFTPQTSIDGYRVTAHRAAAKAGHALGYEDTVWCDTSGRWFDVWLSSEPPAAAKVVVIRDGQRFPAVAKYSEYVQTGKEDKPIGLWGKMPATMTAKCAEALALRMAFPHDLAGVYTAEEMAQADNPAAGERHLRKVQPGEGDPWATPSAVVAAGTADVPAESLTPAGRDYLHEAMAAPDAAAVRQIWQDAKREGARPGYLAQIAEVGKALAHRTPPPAGPASRPATGAQGRSAMPSDEDLYVALNSPHDDVVAAAEHVMDAITKGETGADGEVVEPTATDLMTDAQTAEAELRAAAERVGLTTLDADFEQSYGLPIAEASAKDLRAMTQILTGSAA